MKMIYAIVRNDNEDDVVSQLTQHHYSVTRLSTTGGFLRKGNTTLMIGAEDEKVDEVISLIKQECGQHQKLTVNMPYISGTSMVNYATMPMHVEVGGATIFVVNVERYEKI
ncbi:MAG TPA: cyclic-di-AMP receptor [Candidatus Enterocloster excrementipullorum]|uniref:Cyclic-di-AMP receptor n=1 Tax=Candidatus Enterocloster excrementipullorum TaxID=2838559 RepID=A0A9D2N0D6_9FIRM|nr:cyclic-di-AMP receptor [Candidatus Enterocloster excrementipullorum]